MIIAFRHQSLRVGELDEKLVKKKKKRKNFFLQSFENLKYFFSTEK